VTHEHRYPSLGSDWRRCVLRARRPWESNFPTPTAFNVIAFTGSDPTAAANYLFDMVTVGPTARSYTIAVTPTSAMNVVNAAVEAVYA
jgi:hypothetical protein